MIRMIFVFVFVLLCMILFRYHTVLYCTVALPHRMKSSTVSSTVAIYNLLCAQDDMNE
jgi:hypothetical protein